MKKVKTKSPSPTILRNKVESSFINAWSGSAHRLTADEVNSLVDELHTYQIELELQNEELKSAQIKLEESRRRYSDLYDYAPVGYITLSDKGLVLEANFSAAHMLGVERYKLLKARLSSFIVDDDQDVFYHCRRHLLKSKKTQSCEVKMKREDGNCFYAQLEGIANPSVDGNGGQFRMVLMDISERKRAEQLLQGERHQLESRVKERTMELEAINTALTVLLRKREQDKKKIEDNVVNNIKQLIEPYLEKLRQLNKDKNLEIYCDILKANLNEIISPFISSLSSQQLKFTPTELQIANFIKHGKTSKEIARIMNLSLETIQNHRKHLRKKSGITNKKINLCTSLQSLHDEQDL